MKRRGATHDEPPGTSFVRTYRSGIAARLAGIPVEILRVWERWYGVVGPGLNPRGHRQYSTEDVSRLALIKQLVDLGNPIGSIATLPFGALREMRDAAGAASRGVAAVLDRLLHHAVTLNIRGDSYRLKEKLKAGLVRTEEAEA